MNLFGAGACCALLLLEACGGSAKPEDTLAEVSRLLMDHRHEEALAVIEGLRLDPPQPILERRRRELRLVALAGLGRTDDVLAGAASLHDERSEPLDRSFVARLSGLLFMAGRRIEDVDDLIALTAPDENGQFMAAMREHYEWVRVHRADVALEPSCPEGHPGCISKGYGCFYPGPGEFLFSHDFADWCAEHGLDTAKARW